MAEKFPLLCLCDLRLSQSSGCYSADTANLLMIAIMKLILLSCGDCCGGGNYATAKGGSLANAASTLCTFFCTRSFETSVLQITHLLLGDTSPLWLDHRDTTSIGHGHY